jgi:hypothetical protein
MKAGEPRARRGRCGHVGNGYVRTIIVALNTSMVDLQRAAFK